MKYSWKLFIKNIDQQYKHVFKELGFYGHDLRATLVVHANLQNPATNFKWYSITNGSHMKWDIDLIGLFLASIALQSWGQTAQLLWSQSSIPIG